MIGTIKKLSDKGYGFIRPEDGSKDVFFHATKLNGVHYNDLREGDSVEFEVEDGDKGPQAIGVTVA